MAQRNVLPSLRDKPYGGAWSIHDVEALAVLQEGSSHVDTKDFLNDYKEWIQQDKKLAGLDGYQHVDFSAGTTETFHMFYMRHLDRRLRLFKDEYFYHHMIGRNYFKETSTLCPGTLKKNDLVVMSCPFSGTGNIPENFNEILTECDSLSVPVMLDLAYLNISDIKELDLGFKCITTVTTSLSKVFPVEKNRIGIRLERDLYDDPMVAYNQNDYLNSDSVAIGQKLIKKFDNMWLHDKYKDLQKTTCDEMGLTPSRCVIFGLGSKGTYDDYNRGGNFNRLCFSRTWDKRIK